MIQIDARVVRSSGSTRRPSRRPSVSLANTREPRIRRRRGGAVFDGTLAGQWDVVGGGGDGAWGYVAGGRLRCRDRLASAGSSRYEVRATCGGPDDARHTTESHTIVHRDDVPCAENASKRCEVLDEQTVQIAVDKWTDDFGSNRFIELAHCEQGELVNVTDGEHGPKDPT